MTSEPFQGQNTTVGSSMEEVQSPIPEMEMSGATGHLKPLHVLHAFWKQSPDHQKKKERLGFDTEDLQTKKAHSLSSSFLHPMGANKRMSELRKEGTLIGSSV